MKVGSVVLLVGSKDEAEMYYKEDIGNLGFVEDSDKSTIRNGDVNTVVMRDNGNYRVLYDHELFLIGEL